MCENGYRGFWQRRAGVPRFRPGMVRFTDKRVAGAEFVVTPAGNGLLAIETAAPVPPPQVTVHRHWVSYPTKRTVLNW